MPTFRRCHTGLTAAVILGVCVPPATGCNSDDSSNGPPVEVPPLAAQLVLGGFSHPNFVTVPPGDSRLFVIERTGAIRIIKNGALLPTPFLDITDKVSTGPEQGVMGLWAMSLGNE